MNNKNWYDEAKKDFAKNINDSYTLNLAVSVLEDRKELLNENLKLQQKLQQKEDIINKIKDCVEEFLCSEYYCSQGLELHDFCVKILKILDNKGDENDG